MAEPAGTRPRRGPLSASGLAVTASIAGFLLRMASAGARPLAPDEAPYAVAGAALLDGAAASTLAPLQAVLSALGQVPGGTADWGPRLPAVAASLVLFWAAWRVGQRLVPATPWVPVACVALSPPLVFAGASAEPIGVALGLAALPVALAVDGALRPAVAAAVAGCLLALGPVGGATGAVLTAVWVVHGVGRWDSRAAVEAALAFAATIVLVPSIGLQRVEWLGALAPASLADALARLPVDPAWYALLALAVYAPALGALAIAGLRASPPPALAALLAAVAILLLWPVKDLTPVSLVALASVAPASLALDRLLDRWRRPAPEALFWFALPLIALVFSVLALGSIARPEAPVIAANALGAAAGFWLAMAALACFLLAPLLLLALVVFGRISGRVAAVGALAALLVFEVHAFSSLHFDTMAPELLERSRGAADPARALRAMNARHFDTVRLLTQPDAPLLMWWQARRSVPVPRDNFDPRLLRWTAGDSPGPAVDRGVVGWRWDGSFSSGSALLQWLLYRGGVVPQRLGWTLTQT